MRFLLPIVLCLVTFLTGCVDYQVGVNFATPYSGEITQQIKVSDQLSNLAPSETKKWLNSLEKRSRKLDGKVKKLNTQELLLTIPFGNGAELAEKFNQLFQTNIMPNATIPKEKLDLIKLNSQVSIHQSNLVFVERNSLDLAIDLRALKVLTQDKIIINPDAVANLKFQLTTPWIAHSISNADNLQPTINPLQKGLVWQLNPGEINHIQAVFWLPSPLGIGAAIIILLGILGYLLKYRRFPGMA
ncbi:DUF3153 domain-containing protein [Pleurocapsa sp. CCALA 161]|uniref:DUF3153 domain-containing protein n=1 Tax=Pleurocapsa sp. CCALA 161 TaxID=2107688 RepID=UPI000D07F000|nr:DUF3153 domain-containing protein [Pleurocapsa sp. CCALA 161]PSB07255.1 DUF3153 domain-containing protein [Pleurocapsa sp. CCALA 161]